MINTENFLKDLRAAPYYRGQILRSRLHEGLAPSSMPLSDLTDRVPRMKAGSIKRILSVLGMEDVYSFIIGGLDRAFPADDIGAFGDSILVAGRSTSREILWQLIALTEALDEGRLSLVLCSNPHRSQCAKQTLDSTIEKADISYALSVAHLETEDDFGAFNESVPMIAVIRPEMLLSLLQSSSHRRAKERILYSLGRIIVPSIDEWTPALATNTAYLIRLLHVECAIRGVRPSFAGTSCAVMNLESFVNEFWGRPIRDDSFVRNDSVESPPICFVNYSGAMIRDPRDKETWVRESPKEVASNLLDWLVQKGVAGKYSGTELHYVLDVSASMIDSLPAVSEALIGDLEIKIQSGSIKQGDRVKLTVFDMSARQVFPVEGDGTLTDSTLEEFSSVIRSLEPGGGTNIPVGLGAAMESALSSDSRILEVILFSDGESPILPTHRLKLLRLVRTASSEGRSMALLYVVLDDIDPPLDPPLGIKNLVTELGGTITAKSIRSLAATSQFGTANTKEETIVFVSGEKGLSEEIVQEHQTGTRRLLFTRDTTKLIDPNSKQMVDPKSVIAVVLSGRFGGSAEIKDQVQHLGRSSLPVFILSEAEAWGQMLMEEYPEMDALAMAPLIWTRNPVTLRSRLRSIVRDGEIDAEIFRYLVKGTALYDTMLQRVGTTDLQEHPPTSASNDDIPLGFDLFERSNSMYVRVARAYGYSSESQHTRLDTFTPDTLLVEGAGISEYRDCETSGMLIHPGAIIDSHGRSAQVRKTGAGSVELVRKTNDRYTAILDELSVIPTAEDRWSASARRTERLGRLMFGPAKLSGKVIGYRRYPDSNLDDLYEDTFEDETPFNFDTFGLKWEPTSADGGQLGLDVTVGLANILRLTLAAVFRYAKETVLVYPDRNGCIWILDLAPGGNGASALLFEDHQVIVDLLRVGGRVLLDCACEDGFASPETASGRHNDNGCLRCSRVEGFVILSESSVHRDLYSEVSKRQTLQWLLANRHLPGSGKMHIQEKYEGIDDVRRVIGTDSMSRRGCMKLVRRILHDRLGLDIEDSRLASFEWKHDADDILGSYISGENRISLNKGLREGSVFSVLSHEMFHNYQSECDNLFNHQVLGESGSESSMVDGKLFTEGSAQWASSHVMDALALRSSLTAANLRKGDEYAGGFQLFKYVEESFGVAAVLEFLRTGDISRATGGTISTIGHLLSLAGVEGYLT